MDAFAAANFEDVTAAWDGVRQPTVRRVHSSQEPGTLAAGPSARASCSDSDSGSASACLLWFACLRCSGSLPS